jgi:catechol-2,3-dioxygenase
MTGLALSEMKTAADLELAVAHLVFKVADLKSSCQFYSNLGIPPFFTDEEAAIIELRGGTHLILQQFDLMIEGKGLDELKKYRLELISRGIAAGEIPDETFFGHHLFCTKDPDGNGITIYTSHSIY